MTPPATPRTRRDSHRRLATEPLARRHTPRTRTRPPPRPRVFAAYCLLSAAAATALGAAISLPFPADVRPAAWSAATLLLCATAGLAWDAGCRLACRRPATTVLFLIEKEKND